MAQWSHVDRTLHAKLVYYGPAFGGKTTNLEALHRITDPKKSNKLLSVKTANDRTLFFDLLPLDLGDILGYQVAMKLYTVPGQVRYDTTRQVVLAGADALVFVADSSASRKEQNVWSLQNLHMNMRAQRLDPSRVPVLYQFNKQDLPDSAPPNVVADWLGVPVKDGFPAVAIEGKGVLETFMAASKTMLQKLVAMADEATRREIDEGELERQLDRAFAPFVARLSDGEEQGPVTEGKAESPIVLDDENLLEGAVQAGVRLGEELTTELTRAGRLEREAEAFRRLSELLGDVGASFDRQEIVMAALEAIKEILEVPVVTLVRDSGTATGTILDRALGCEEEPLLDFPEGREFLDQMRSTGGPCVVEELSAECPMPDRAIVLKSLCAVAAVPVEGQGRLSLVAYAAAPDGLFRQPDVRFMVTVAGHLSVGLEKARLHEDLSGHRDRLEQMVTERTDQLREAYEELRQLEEMKDRFLANLSHEMKSPLTAVLSAATVLRDYDSDPVERKELVGSIVTSGEILQRQLDDLFRLVNLEQGHDALEIEDVKPEQLVQEAIQLSGASGVQFKIEKLPEMIQIDLIGLGRAVSNLIDNAEKFSPTSSLVKLRLSGCRMKSGDGLMLSVLDRGPGVPEEDRERIFGPFEQGGNTLNSKPRGIGIGLHEARTMAERHGGCLEYLPRKDGGSEFRMTIPLQSVAEGAALEESLV